VLILRLIIIIIIIKNEKEAIPNNFLY